MTWAEAFVRMVGFICLAVVAVEIVRMFREMAK